MKHERLVFTSILISFIVTSCNRSEVFSEKFDYINSLEQLVKIRENQLFIPVKLIDKDFDIANIDFGKHQGIIEDGVSNLIISRGVDYLELIISSPNIEFDNAVIKVIPNALGFETETKLSNGGKYLLSWDRDDSKKDKFIYVAPNGEVKIISIQNLSAEYEQPVLLNFRVAGFVLFAVRELYFKYLLTKIPESYLLDMVERVYPGSPDLRTTTCELWPSQSWYAVCTRLSLCEDQINFSLPSKCSNEYCIGCCYIAIDSYCLGGDFGCYALGSGYACDGVIFDEGDYSNCKPNYPCPF